VPQAPQSDEQLWQLSSASQLPLLLQLQGWQSLAQVEQLSVSPQIWSPHQSPIVHGGQSGEAQLSLVEQTPSPFRGGQGPQSASHVVQRSPPAQKPSPQPAQAPQSAAQL
jgi:hypothetical protein